MEYKPSFVDQLDVDYISHHGIKGMHWGVRRFEDENGHLTPAGKKRYAVYGNSSGFKTFGDRDLKRANKYGGTVNRDSVRWKAYNSAKSNKQIKAAEDECRKTTRECYAAFANAYNKQASKMGVNDRADPKTFNYYKDVFNLDSDVEEAVWDSGDDLFLKLEAKHKKSIDSLERLHKEHAKKFIQAYDDAVLADISNDGSKKATDRILKKYGARATGRISTFDVTDGFEDGDDPNYGCSSYELFDL